MSVLQYAGSSQLAATAVLAADGGAAAAVAAGVMLNARFLPMSVVAAPALRGSRLRRSIEAQTIVDTSWALATRGQAGFDREAMLGATLPQYRRGCWARQPAYCSADCSTIPRCSDWMPSFRRSSLRCSSTRSGTAGQSLHASSAARSRLR
jgi:AzlC protein